MSDPINTLPTGFGKLDFETMSSREIAELLESRHDNVKRTIERLAERGLIRFTPSEETSHNGAGSRSVEVYRVDKRDSYVVVAQLSPEFTARRGLSPGSQLFIEEMPIKSTPRLAEALSVRLAGVGQLHCGRGWLQLSRSPSHSFRQSL